MWQVLKAPLITNPITVLPNNARTVRTRTLHIKNHANDILNNPIYIERICATRTSRQHRGDKASQRGTLIIVQKYLNFGWTLFTNPP